MLGDPCQQHTQGSDPQCLGDPAWAEVFPELSIISLMQ